MGLEDGKIEIFHLKAGEVKPEAAGALELHHKSPVTHLSVSSRQDKGPCGAVWPQEAAVRGL